MMPGQVPLATYPVAFSPQSVAVFAEGILVQALLASPVVAAAVVDPEDPSKYRISPLESTQGDGLLRITYKQVVLVPSTSLDGNTGNLDQVRIQTDCWGRDFAQVKALAAAVRAAVADRPKHLLVSSFEDYDSDSKLYRSSQDFNLWARPS